MPKSLRKRAYEVYLRSSHWADLIRRKSTYGGDQCLGCNRYDGLALHHMIYRERWTDARLTDLVWLCPTCHTRFHKQHKSMLPKALDLTHAELLRQTKAACQRPKRLRPILSKVIDTKRAKAKQQSQMWRIVRASKPLHTPVNSSPVFVKRS